MRRAARLLRLLKRTCRRARESAYQDAQEGLHASESSAILNDTALGSVLEDLGTTCSLSSSQVAHCCSPVPGSSRDDERHGALASASASAAGGVTSSAAGWGRLSAAAEAGAGSVVSLSKRAACFVAAAAAAGAIGTDLCARCGISARKRKTPMRKRAF